MSRTESSRVVRTLGRRPLAGAGPDRQPVHAQPAGVTGAPGGGVQSDVAVAAQKTYVAPGDLDEYYMFSSGGHSGPDLRLRPAVDAAPLDHSGLSRPTRRPATASTTTSKKMLGDLTWGDAHHPALSETKGDYDGRWLFVNEMNGRIARIDLRDFKTKQILGPVPNLHGNHASSFVTPNTEYAMMATPLLAPGAEARGRQSTSTPPSTRASSPASRSTPRSARCRSAGRS